MSKQTKQTKQTKELKQPKNLDDAISILNDFFLPQAKDEFKAIKDSSEAHFGLGMHMRNHWGLWHQETPIVQWFVKTHGIDHADDMSGIILDTWHRQLNGLQPRVEELVKKYKAHWAKFQK